MERIIRLISFSIGEKHYVASKVYPVTHYCSSPLCGPENQTNTKNTMPPVEYQCTQIYTRTLSDASVFMFEL
ncbi:hypothetical protein [Vibrio neptunius]|uniref:hypothetical protein n=1 Tax=Vibrio neptunius TaxID=170651 RepID=UPI003CE49972